MEAISEFLNRPEGLIGGMLVALGLLLGTLAIPSASTTARPLPLGQVSEALAVSKATGIASESGR